MQVKVIKKLDGIVDRKTGRVFSRGVLCGDGT